MTDSTTAAPPASPPSGTIDFYFDFISPYGWIAAEQIGTIARRFNRAVNWQPFLLRITVMEVMEATPPLEIPLKGAYLLHDIKRMTRFHGLTMSDQAGFAFNSVPASRLIVWARKTAPQMLEPLTLSLYRAHWAAARDISKVETVLAVAQECGLAVKEAQLALEDSAIKEAFRDEVRAAVDRGVFGSPSIIVDDELFWGADRLPMVEEWLVRGGW